MIGSELLIKNIISEILFENRICESLENNQIVEYIYNELYERRLLYGEPLTIEELRNILRQKIVHFEFIKLNGEVRDVPRGTTMMKYVPTADHPKGIRPSSPKVATFYDLEKMDWRSVSQRSKEIVLKKDEETGKPIIMVKDKPDGGDVAVKPEEPTQPKATIDGRSIEEPIQPEEKPEVSKVKPIEKTEGEKRFYFVNPVTGASIIMDTTAKETIKKLKELGKDWKLATEKEYQDQEEKIKQSSEIEPEVKKEINSPKQKTIFTPKNIINKQSSEDLDNIEAEEIE
jgi:hypothetical protein